MIIEGIGLPSMHIVVQVVFGAPLSAQQIFRSGHVERLTKETIGIGNHMRTLNKLVALGWLEARPGAPEQRGGRPSTTVYSRTHKGNAGYVQLKCTLAKFGIVLT